MKKPPTDEELKETVKKLLASANLEEVTMKQICKEVYENYPAYDLTERKEFIKTTVKEVTIQLSQFWSFWTHKTQEIRVNIAYFSKYLCH